MVVDNSQEKHSQAHMTEWIDCFTNCKFLCLYFHYVFFIIINNCWPVFVAFFQFADENNSK